MARKDFRQVRDRFARDNGLPFGRLLSREYVLSVLESEGHSYRNRTFCPLTTLWAWLSQCLSQDKSLNEAVSRVLAHRVATGLPTISASNSAYTQARNRFPESVMTRLAKEIGRNVHDSAAEPWKWHGREVFLPTERASRWPTRGRTNWPIPRAAVRRPGLASRSCVRWR